MLVPPCWVGNAGKEVPLAVAARLQAWYRFWLLPYEAHVLHTHAAAVATVTVPALLLRRLSEDREHDVLIKYLVKSLTPSPHNDHAGANLTGAAGARPLRSLCVCRAHSARTCLLRARVVRASAPT